jgi:hypothetical protein
MCILSLRKRVLFYFESGFFRARIIHGSVLFTQTLNEIDGGINFFYQSKPSEGIHESFSNTTHLEYGQLVHISPHLCIIPGQVRDTCWLTENIPPT